MMRRPLLFCSSSLLLLASELVRAAENATLAAYFPKATIDAAVEKYADFKTTAQAYTYFAYNRKPKKFNAQKLCPALDALTDINASPRSIFYYILAHVGANCPASTASTQPSLKLLDVLLTEFEEENLELKHYFAVTGLSTSTTAKSKKKKCRGLLSHYLEKATPVTAGDVMVMSALLNSRDDPTEGDEKKTKAVKEWLASAVSKVNSESFFDSLTTLEGAATFLLGWNAVVGNTKRAWLGKNDKTIAAPVAKGAVIRLAKLLQKEQKKPGVSEIQALAQYAVQVVTDSGILEKQAVEKDLFFFRLIDSKPAKDDKSLTVQVEACTIFGRVPGSATIKVGDSKFTALKGGKGCTLETKIPTASGAKDFLKTNAGHGVFSLQFGASSSKQQSPIIFREKWEDSYSLSVQKLVINQGRGEQKREVFSLAKDKVKTALLAKLDDSASLLVEASFTDGTSGDVVRPQQVSFVLKAVGDEQLPLGLPSTQVIPFSQSADSFSLNLQLSNKKLVVPYDGDYELSIIIGDKDVQGGGMWQKIGKAKLLFSQPAELTLATHLLPKSSIGALSTSQLAAFAAAPIIEHMFRQPEARANPIFPTIFFAAVAFVVVVFIFVACSSWNVQLLVGGQAQARLNTYLFIGGLFSMVGLLWAFFFWMTLFGLAQILVPAFVVLIFIGNSELCACKEARSARKKEE
ncbi:unnamed protein product [Amoebophrya sp. A25]|nr:unnamed protein product [Amoebophrya sp. A25]|eukprot:GSA25T00023758001.1